jgi:hypothetical protein
MSMRRAYLKHGLAVPDSIERAAKHAEEQAWKEWGQAKTNAQSSPADDPVMNGLLGSSPSSGKTSTPVVPVPGDVEFLITAQVGNHNLSLDLDTGSSDL